MLKVEIKKKNINKKNQRKKNKTRGTIKYWLKLLFKKEKKPINVWFVGIRPLSLCMTFGVQYLGKNN
jgi:hypothetical protein